MEPAPQYILTDEYFQRLEPHYYRFEIREEGPVLALHRNSDNNYIGVYVPIEYGKGFNAYENLIMSYDSAMQMAEWFNKEDQKPF
jgi:hypothetical protein